MPSTKGSKKDLYPEWIVTQWTLSGADTPTQKIIQIPINKIQGKAGSATIIEILWAEIYPEQFPTVASNSLAVGIATSDLTIATSDTSGYTAFGSALGAFVWVAGFTTSGYNSFKFPGIINFSTNDGHGILVATDRLFLSADTAAWGSTLELTVKIFYRFVTVSLQEYVGIVQSQSQ